MAENTNLISSSKLIFQKAITERARLVGENQEFYQGDPLTTNPVLPWIIQEWVLRSVQGGTQKDFWGRSCQKQAPPPALSSRISFFNPSISITPL